MLRSPKQKFVITAYFLVEYLISLTKPRKRDPRLEHVDSYGMWIRRTVKSGMLARLAKEMEAVTP
jgi:hypothetical protein